MDEEQVVNLSELSSIEEEYQLMEFLESKFSLATKNNKNNESTLRQFQSQMTRLLSKNNENIINILYDNTDKIIKMYEDLKNTKEDLIKSKRNMDSLSNQILILKKKYIEPYDKLAKNIINKKNIDETINLYEKLKNIKIDLKMLKISFEKDKKLIIDTQHSSALFQRIKNEIATNANSESFKNIKYIKEELTWFIENEAEILEFYKQKFANSVRSLDNSQIIKSLEFLNGLGNQYMINEIKNFSNKTLKEIMIEKLYKQIVLQSINAVPANDLNNENIRKIRNEIKDFFIELNQQSQIMKNLGDVISVYFDKNTFLTFDDIMETEGLRGIYSLFMEKINSTFKQIIEKLTNNQKFQNANAYFLKDFPFFYFCVKFYSLNLFQLPEFSKESISFEQIQTQHFCFFNSYKLINLKLPYKAAVINLNELKSRFIYKFKGSVSENFERAFNLHKLHEKNFENNFSNLSLLRESIINENVTLYLINYIKQMSWSYIDLSDEFGLNSEEIILDSDLFLHELSTIFSDNLNEFYFEKIKLKLEEILKEIKAATLNIQDSNSNTADNSASKSSINNQSTEALATSNTNAISNIVNTGTNVINNNETLNKFSLLILKFFYYLGILYKMNEVLLTFQVSNIKYLITHKLKEAVEHTIRHYTQQIMDEFLKRITKDIKFILINKDFASFQSFFQGSLKWYLNLFFSKSYDFIFKGLEKQVSKFFVFLYLFISSLLILSVVVNTEEQIKLYADFVFLVNDYSKFKFEQGNNFKKITNLISELLKIKNEKSQDSCFNTTNIEKFKAKNKKTFNILINLRKLYLNEAKLTQFLKQKRVNMDSFIKIVSKLLMEKIKIKFKEFNFGIDPRLLKHPNNPNFDLFKEVEDFIFSEIN